MNPKYIRIFSDIHLDFDIPNKIKNFSPDIIWTPPPLDSDKETILILAGDIWHAKKPFQYFGFSWFKKISEQFHTILVILGNHDFWGGNIKTEYAHYNNYVTEQNITNLFLIQNTTFKIGDLKFIGGTLWTDFNNLNDTTLQLASDNMNDYKYIKNGLSFSKLKPNHLLGEHRQTLDYIKENATKDYSTQKLWVLTHHAPSLKSLHPDYKDDYFFHQNGLYASDLDYIMEENDQIDVWVHGHCHNFTYYKINNTKIISNPRGYRFEETNYLSTSVFDFEGKLISN